MDMIDADKLVEAIRAYRGVVRKSPISSVASRLLPLYAKGVIATHGEDAAAIEFGSEVLLMAADGIRPDLIQKNPRWAGYCAVLVNVNDISAMGGLPIAAVNVLSCSDASKRRKIVDGMRSACDKFGVPMVGGHLHPDTIYDAIDVAILGKTDREHLLLSSGARDDDSIIFAMDLSGRFTRGLRYSWDTTSMKTSAEVQKHVRLMHRMAPMLSSGKDISNPGSLGTLGMLLESSSCGGEVDVSLIPRPRNVDLLQWLLAYQGFGFVVTCEPSKVRSVLNGFKRVGVQGARCGMVTSSQRLDLIHQGESRTLFDFGTDTFGCSNPQKL
ncbi:MAG: methanogenesis marker 2 protein [Thermoplasmata archaeon]|nr:methanogenesis marker 2 protein [Thermoplasmata archaeon]